MDVIHTTWLTTALMWQRVLKRYQLYLSFAAGWNGQRVGHSHKVLWRDLRF